MAAVPRAQLLALAKQYVQFVNSGRLGDIVGLLHPDAVVNGFSAVDCRVQLSLAWVRGAPAWPQSSSAVTGRVLGPRAPRRADTPTSS